MMEPTNFVMIRLPKVDNFTDNLFENDNIVFLEVKMYNTKACDKSYGLKNLKNQVNLSEKRYRFRIANDVFI